MKLNTRYFYDKYKANGGILDYSIFYKIMNSYFDKITDACINQGVGLNLRSNLGFLSVNRIERNIKIKDNGQIKGHVDWKSSNELKRKLIEEGKTPLEYYKNAKGEITGDNGGTPWMCFHTNSTYYRWSYTPNIYLKNCKRVIFKPSWTNNRKLGKGITEDNEILHL